MPCINDNHLTALQTMEKVCWDRHVTEIVDGKALQTIDHCHKKCNDRSPEGHSLKTEKKGGKWKYSDCKIALDFWLETYLGRKQVESGGNQAVKHSKHSTYQRFCILTSAHRLDAPLEVKEVQSNSRQKIMAQWICAGQCNTTGCFLPWLWYWGWKEAAIASQSRRAFSSSAPFGSCSPLATPVGQNGPKAWTLEPWSCICAVKLHSFKSSLLVFTTFLGFPSTKGTSLLFLRSVLVTSVPNALLFHCLAVGAAAAAAAWVDLPSMPNHLNAGFRLSEFWVCSDEKPLEWGTRRTKNQRLSLKMVPSRSTSMRTARSQCRRAGEPWLRCLHERRGGNQIYSSSTLDHQHKPRRRRRRLGYFSSWRNRHLREVISRPRRARSSPPWSLQKEPTGSVRREAWRVRMASPAGFLVRVDLHCSWERAWQSSAWAAPETSLFCSP